MTSFLRRTWPATALVVAWSSGFVGAELGTEHASAATLLAWRYLAAAGLLLLACAWARQRIDAAGLRRQAVLGLLVQVGYLGPVVLAVSLGVPSGTAALVAALQPLVVLLLAAALLAEPVRRALVVALLVGLAGVVLVVAGDLGTGTAPWWAFALPALGMLSLAVGTVLEQRWQPPEPLLVALTAQTTVAAVVLGTAAVVLGEVAPPAAPSFWGAVAWVVVLSTFGGYGAYALVTRTQGATRASTLLYLTPPTTMVWAALALGAGVTVLGLVGLAVCAVGVVAALRATRPVGASAGRGASGTGSPARP